MADQTVADTSDRFELKHALDALRKTAQAMAVLRAVWLAVEAQEDGSVRFDENSLSRWGPAVDAVISRMHAVRSFFIDKTHAPDCVDWWTPLTLTEAIGAALWHGGTSTVKNKLESEEVQSCADAAIEALGAMYEEISLLCGRLEDEAIQEGLRD